MLVKNLKLCFAILFFGSMFVACGDSDSGSDNMSKSAAPAASTSGGMAGDSMDNGVIYQDEIYKNWPYQ